MKTLTDTMDFGKYSDKTVKWVIDNDLYYFEWTLDMDWYEVDAKTFKYYEDVIDYLGPLYEDYSHYDALVEEMFND